MDAQDSNEIPYVFGDQEDSRYDLGGMFDCVPDSLQSNHSQLSLPQIQPNFFTEESVSKPSAANNSLFQSPSSIIPVAVNQSNLPFYSRFPNPKRVMGLQHFFVDESEPYFDGQIDRNEKGQKQGQRFLERIDSRVLGNSSISQQFSLSKLFGDQHTKRGEQVEAALTELRKKIEEIHHRSLTSINLNKTISSSFHEHFSNFTLLFSPSNFSSNLTSSLSSLISHCSKLHSPSPDLITSLYDFWMRQFREFVQQIWRCSQKYTLGVFKKQKQGEREDRSVSEASSSQYKGNKRESNQGTSVSTRKPWTADQLRILEELINSNIIFSQSVLKKLSAQLSRSPSSISSKLQKLQKSLNPTLTQSSLLSRMIHTLKMYPNGLTRQSLIQKINQNYEMGYGGSWQKSVGQLLARTEFNRTKGRYKLIGGNNGGEKGTFKDRVVECLLRCQGMESTLQGIVSIYCQLYPQQQIIGVSQSERIKSIQANISKTLSRYDIFDCSNSRTVYTLLSNQQPLQQQDDKIQKYLEL